MIYYFSATGNSKHVANRLAEALNESVTPVLEVLNLGIKVDDRMILVYPNYCGGVPSVIREFLQKNIFQISKDAKLILASLTATTPVPAHPLQPSISRKTPDAPSMPCTP